MKPVHQTTAPDNPIRDKTTTSWYHNRPTSDPITKSDHQIPPAPPNQTIGSDHPTRAHTSILDYTASNQHSTAYLLKWYRSGAFLMGWVNGGYIELWRNLAKHTFHTRSAWSFRTFFRLNLIVVRLVSGFPGLVRASPSLFHRMGSFAGVRSAIRVRLLGIGSAFWTRPGFYETVRLHLLAPFSGGLRHAAVFVVVVVVVVFTTTSRLVAPNLNWSITLHLIVYALVKWSFHPQGSTRQWLF